MTEYFKIGKLVAVHGLSGELLLKHELGKKTSLKGLPAIFVEEKKNSFIPWFIESTKIKSQGGFAVVVEVGRIKTAGRQVEAPDAAVRRLVIGVRVADGQGLIV